MAVPGNSWRMQLLIVDALVEGATGLALIIIPDLVSRLLFGTPLNTVGIAVARVAGIALFSLSVGCWTWRSEAAGKVSALIAMLIYNLLVTPYLIYLGIGGELVGILLWPAAAVHAVFTLLLAYALMRPSEATMRKQ